MSLNYRSPTIGNTEPQRHAVYEVLVEIDCLALLPNKYLWPLIDQIVDAALGITEDTE